MASIILHSFFERARSAESSSDRLAYTERSTKDYSCYDVEIQNRPMFGCSLLESDYDKEVNRRTWQVLTDQLIFVYGAGRLGEICKRFGLDLSEKQNSKKPLFVKDLVQLGVGFAHIKVEDVEQVLKEDSQEIENENQKNPQQVKSQRIQAAMAQLNPYHYLGMSAPSYQLLGGPTSLGQYFTHDALFMEQRRLALFSDIDRLTFEGFIERFGKAIVSHEMEEGTLVPVPLGEGKVEYFTVHRKIGGGGLVAYALCPIEKDSTSLPILFFRPTQTALGAEDAIETWLNDLEPKLGSLGYITCKQALGDVIQVPQKRWIIVGYSLGGAHAQRFLCDHREYVREAIFINDPFIDAETAEAFAAKINAEKEGSPPLTVKIHLTYARLDPEELGDRAHCVGEKHVGFGVHASHVHVEVELQAPENPVPRSIMEHHSVRTKDLSKEKFIQKNIVVPEERDVYLNNLDPRKGKEVEWYESFRNSCIMRALYHIIYCFYSIFKAIFAFFGCKVYRTAEKVN